MPAVVTRWTAAPSRLMASRNMSGSTLVIGPGPTAVKAPSMASSGRRSIQLMSEFYACGRTAERMTDVRPLLFRRPRLLRRSGIGDVIRIEPGRIGPAVLVVFRHALIG